MTGSIRGIIFSDVPGKQPTASPPGQIKKTGYLKKKGIYLKEKAIFIVYGAILFGALYVGNWIYRLNPENRPEAQVDARGRKTETLSPSNTNANKQNKVSSDSSYASREEMDAIREKIRQLSQVNYSISSNGKSITYHSVAPQLRDFTKKHSGEIKVSLMVEADGNVSKTNYQITDEKNPSSASLRTEINRMMGGDEKSIRVEPANIISGDSLMLRVDGKLEKIGIIDSANAIYTSEALFAKLLENNFMKPESKAFLFIDPATGRIYAAVSLSGPSLSDASTQQRLLEIIRAYGSREQKYSLAEPVQKNGVLANSTCNEKEKILYGLQKEFASAEKWRLGAGSSSTENRLYSRKFLLPVRRT